MTSRAMNADVANDSDLDSDLDSDSAPIAVHVLTGFLGSGKTTLLNRMIRDPAFVNSAIVVNEFGDVGVDHLLVSRGQDQDATLALVGGCLCCELRDGLALTLIDLLARRQSGQCMQFDRIIIETTGLADPTPILNLLVTDAVLAEATVVGGVLTVVDAVNAQSTLAGFVEAVTQIVLADQIVVTKTDLLDAAVDGLAQRLRALNGEALLYPTGLSDLPSLHCLLARAPRVPLLHLHEHGEHEHGADVAHVHTESHIHDADVQTFSVVRDDPIPGAALSLFVQALAEQLGTDLLRVKGLVCLAESPERPMLLQGAQRVFHPVVQLDEWPQSHRPHTRLVFIVRGPLRTFVEHLLSSLIWEATDISARLIQSKLAAGDGEQAQQAANSSDPSNSGRVSHA